VTLLDFFSLKNDVNVNEENRRIRIRIHPKISWIPNTEWKTSFVAGRGSNDCDVLTPLLNFSNSSFNQSANGI
jgi:hypothetical protein